MNRLNTDDTFSQRMEGFTFETPLLERDPSGILFVDSLGEPTAKCSPDISKPDMARESTFDQRLEQMNFAVPRPQFSRTDSGFSLASFDMLAEDEVEVLEESCGMPSRQQRFTHGHFYANFNCDMRLEADGDVVMADTPSTMAYTNRRSHPSHWSV